MISSSQAPRGAFSVTRLAHLWVNAKAKIPKQFVLGGEYIQTDSVAQLVGQGLAVNFTEPDSFPQPGSFVWLQCELSNLSEEDGQLCLERFEVIGHKPHESNPAGPPAKVAIAWAIFKDQVEAHLKSIGLMSVQTPALVVNPGMEPELKPFQTQWKLGSRQQSFFLPTSPELHMKRFLANGFTDIFEIKTCFRNDELSELHEAEFQMLEWYRAYADLDLIQQDLLGLLRAFWPDLQMQFFTVSELFQKHFDFDLSPKTSLEEITELAKSQKLHISADDSWDDVYHRLFLEFIEPTFKNYPALILRDYPPSQAALAEIKTNGFADRMELYLGGVEVANAFTELTDAQEQRLRFETDLEKRAVQDKEVLPIDENFMRDLEKGMPPSGGIALGLDRLFMCVYGFKNIQQTRAFPMEDVLKGFQ